MGFKGDANHLSSTWTPTYAEMQIY